tara:strand:+ start:389 stop:964 length:576 start_codon:yes stop_codon:yes gene_type:complete
MSEQIIILIQIILIDLVLAADNAIIIGMLASKFNPNVRKKIFFWGISVAVILRIIFTFLTAYLLQIKGLKLFGGFVLLWVVYKLYKDVIKKTDAKKINFNPRNQGLISAVFTIALADISLSLDNVLGVAGAAKQHYDLLVFGLIFSIIIMATMANAVSKMITKFSWIAWLGLFAILYVALELIYSDLKILI